MSKPGATNPVERLFPFVLRAGILIVGRDQLRRSKGKLHFVLITTDLSEGSRAEVLSEFTHYPVVQRYTSADLEQFFKLKGTKVLGFGKSGLAQSVYAEMKASRINQPLHPSKGTPAGVTAPPPEAAPPASPPPATTPGTPPSPAGS